MSTSPEAAVRDSGTDGYRRVHRISPLLRFWTVLLALVAVVVGNTVESVFEALRGLVSGKIHVDVRPLLIVIGGFAAVCALVWLVSGIWWRAAGYRLTGEEVVHRQGVVGVRVRTARYDRIQAVDLVESVIARIFGLAAVRIETAGGDDSVIEISYLNRRTAERLRMEILELLGKGGTGTRVRDIPSAGDPDTEPDPGADAGEVIVAPIPVVRSLVATFLSGWFLLAAPAFIIVIIQPGFLGMLWPLFIGAIPAMWNLIDNSWRFTVRQEGGEDLDIAYGLADRRRQTLKMSRVHSVEIRQWALWRLAGWWSVQVCVAGYGMSEGGGTTKILPVGTREEAIRVAALLSPLTAPEVEESAQPEGWTRPDLRSPRRARWVSPICWGRRAVTFAGGAGADDRDLPYAVILHGGRFSRRVSMVALPHIQEITLETGPIGRLLDLASVQLHLVEGPVQMVAADLRNTDAQWLLELLRRRRLPDPPSVGKGVNTPE
ncbi:PH domain-containing protein [Corynebacterium sp. CCM 8835]|uniref:PH domain-containing protein n=4 Tax=Corynebacterium antarcticum TaxID=2800405 RepID=A0ABS1FN08_9CORY|nr:PH domain-containing protein [Corynebacterium antarcticum]MCK7642282.1 PH domain-containing protein [Corynebacterium antarcticum]MCK7661034.1 PH domain-containing protein [Corynebacterium antarcticum]MCL0245781.1 PH domain-containing protein [Corynebacterium antarcticum]MCX7491763.1 PH domain-containing protein [Corynebacterium antarcticum]